MQMNKLLKVLEDRKVLLESAYYNENDRNIPAHIHDIFQNGLPADFRLVGATTRMPNEISSPLRSRCMEVFFKPLEKEDLQKIVINAVTKVGIQIDDEAVGEIIKYAGNGREAVNIVQLAAGITQVENSCRISLETVEKVLNNGRFSPRPEVRPGSEPAIGIVNGLAVQGANVGMLIEVEAKAIRVEKGSGNWTVTGVIDQEEVGGEGRKLIRKSMARGAVENVLTVLRSEYGLEILDYDLHLNFPGGIPVDGPSAGVSIATAIYSAITQKPIYHLLAMTGEVSVHGKVKAVGGVMTKVDAARKAGIKKVIIPSDNWLSIFENLADIEVIAVKELGQVDIAFVQ